MKPCTEPQWRYIVIKLKDWGLGHPERNRFYRKQFGKRYVCDKDHPVKISKNHQSCPICGQGMEHKITSTKHLSFQEAHSLIDAFRKKPEKSREKVFEILGYLKLL